MTELRIDDLADLAEVVRAMDRIGDQAQQLGDFMRTWVCRRGGFETSDVCLFRPVGALLGRAAGAFDDFVGDFGSGWADLAEGVAQTHRSLVDVEAEVVTGLSAVLA
jgi:hypothetical protein